MMTEYLYPLATVVLDFFCVLFCIRLTASRRGLVWLIPMAMSLALLAGSAVCLIANASDIAGERLSTAASYASMFLLGLSVIWLVTIIAFNHKTRPDRRFSEDRKALNEADYVRKHAVTTYRYAADRRPTASHRIRQTRSLEIAEKSRIRRTDMYTQGVVSAVRVRKTASN